MRFFQWILQFSKSLFKLKEAPIEVQGKQKPLSFEPSQVQSKPLKKVNYISKQVDDKPERDEIEDNTVYIVGENGYQWLAAFKCPCGCKGIIQLNLLPEASPCWRVRYSRRGKISLYPSIERIIGCRSHFKLTNGKASFWENNTCHP